MRKAAVFALALIGVLLLGATVMFYSKYRQSEENYARMTAEEEKSRTRYGEAINEIMTIQDSLNAIVLGEDAAHLIPPGNQPEGQISPTLRDQVLTRISTLRAGLERTKERIQQLDASLKRSGVKIAGLEKMVAGLRRTVSEKETQIAQLDTQVDSLQTTVQGLTVEVADTKTELADRQRELATVYYTMGTKKDLIRSGVVVAKGGVLGFGKTLKPSGQYNESGFNQLDTALETVIRIPAEKAQVLSPQPVTSYVLTPAGENMVELRIVNPEEFRKIRHLVILMS